MHGIETEQAVDASLTTESWLERVAALSPVIEEWRDVGEQERRMPRPLFEALGDAGLMRIGVPTACGGLELNVESMVRVIEALSRLDGAVGWNVMIAANAALVAAVLPAAPQLYAANPKAVVAGSLRPLPGNVAVPEPGGGYRVTGRWPIASGCHHADWGAGACFVQDDGRTRMLAEGMPDLRVFFVPAAQCEILDTWYTTGMRGTGSNDLQVNNVLVAEEWCLALRPSGPSRTGALSLKAFGVVAAPQLAAVALGIARAAIDGLKELAIAKTPHGGASVLASQHTIHERLGRAEALLRSARAYYYETVREVARHAGLIEDVSDQFSADVRLACAHCAQTAAEAVDLMYAAGGITATYTSSRLDRCFRDVHMATQHVVIAASNIEMVGQYLLGGPLQIRR